MTVDLEIKENIESRQARFLSLMRTEGIEVAVKDGYAEKCRCLLPDGRVIFGHSELLTYLRADSSENEFSFKFEDVTGNGEWAFVRGVYKSEKNGKEVDNGKFITIWRKVDGKFVIYNDMWNSSLSQ